MDQLTFNPMSKAFSKAKELVKTSEDVKIYTHIDCDGICAGAILSSTLEKLGIEPEIVFISLDQIENLKPENELTIFADLGSGQRLPEFENSATKKTLILDHHTPIREFGKIPEILEINPHFYNIDGTHAISGGGMAYLLSKTFGLNDLSWIGVLSAVGDMQNNLTGKLVGLNKSILHDSVKGSKVDIINDLSFYGRQTRPLYLALSYFGDVKLPITNNRNEVIRMLNLLDIPLKNGNGNRPRYLCDLTHEEKIRLFHKLLDMFNREVPSRYLRHGPRLFFGEAYEFLDEKMYSPLRDASEFSTAVNACSRNREYDTALQVLKGDRKKYLKKMKGLIKDHRHYLAENMDQIREKEDFIVSQRNLQYFEGYGIKSEVIGTITGMMLSYGDWRKPILGFTYSDENNDKLKVSLRCSRLLAFENIHFGKIISQAARKVGGVGGGHSVACGAYIPEDKQRSFLELMDINLEKLLPAHE